MEFNLSTANQAVANTAIQQGSETAGSNPTLWIVIGVAVLVVAVLAFLIARSRKS